MKRERGCHISFYDLWQPQQNKQSNNIFDNFAIEYKNYDIIKGYRADDSYFAFANAFLNNTISVSQLEKAMVLGKLGEQVVAISEKAFGAFEFVDSTTAHITKV